MKAAKMPRNPKRSKKLAKSKRRKGRLRETTYPYRRDRSQEKGKEIPNTRKEIEMEYFNESDVKIIMLIGKNEREAKRELERGTYVMELQSFIDNYREIPEEMKASDVIDDDDYAKELEYTERVISAVTETAEHIKNLDEYFEIADEFNTVVNFDGKQYVIHWTL